MRNLELIKSEQNSHSNILGNSLASAKSHLGSGFPLQSFAFPYVKEKQKDFHCNPYCVRFGNN